MILSKHNIGVLGATSLVGEFLLPLLVEREWDVVAFSRRERDARLYLKNLSIEWQILRPEVYTTGNIPAVQKQIAYWICLAPIWTLPQYFSLLSLYGVRRIVALSSTSRFTKDNSPDPAEKALAKRLADGEENIIAWAKTNNITWTILRPTLTYGLGRDGNVSAIARFIKRFSFFPILGAAQGLRQPMHARDAAQSCLSALVCEAAVNRFYNLSGGETLSYREMVNRIFLAMGKKACIVNIPLWFFRLVVTCSHLLPHFRQLSAAMAERMNQDLIFNHEDASRDFNFFPRPFILTGNDLPR